MAGDMNWEEFLRSVEPEAPPDRITKVAACFVELEFDKVSDVADATENDLEAEHAFKELKMKEKALMRKALRKAIEIHSGERDDDERDAQDEVQEEEDILDDETEPDLQKALRAAELSLTTNQCILAATLSDRMYSPNFPADLPDNFALVVEQKQDLTLGNFTQLCVIEHVQTKDIYAVWRGSSSSLDFLADANVLPLQKPEWNASVHSGMMSLLSQDVFNLESRNLQRLTELLEHGKTRPAQPNIIFCGHSLGGGIAQIAAVSVQLSTGMTDLQKLLHGCRDRCFAVTFAAPMVLSFRNGQSPPPCLKKMCLNFVNTNDLVARLPAMGEHYLTTHIDSVQQLASITLRRSSNSVVSSMSWVLEGLVKEGVSALVKGTCGKFPTVGKGYQHCCTLMTLRGGTVTVASEADLEVFDEDHEHLERGSIITDHSVMTYLKQVQVSAAIWAFGKDMLSKIATYDIPPSPFDFLQCVAEAVMSSQLVAALAVGTGLAVTAAWAKARSREPSDCLPKVALVANRKVLNALAGDDGCTLPFGLITFNGNSTNGKSFLISELLGHGCEQTPYVVPSSKLCKGATTGDCSVFPLEKQATREIWCLDCEGTNGTCFPAALGDFGRNMLARFGLDSYRARADLVKRTLPIFSFLMGHVFVYVTRESCSNLTAYGEVLEYALRATQRVQNSIKPSLVVIENKAPCSRHTIAETTAEFLQRDAESGDSWLSKHFEDVRFVQIFVKGKPRYNARLAEFRKLLIQLADCNLKSQKIQLGFDVNKADWCQAATRVIEEIGDGEDTRDHRLPFLMHRRQVNMFDVYAEQMDKRGRFFFTDSLHVFRILDNSEHERLDDLKKANKHAWDVALDHAARLLACEFKGFEHTATKQELKATLSRLLKSLRDRLCCCAKKGDGKTEFCGQPFLGHGRNLHKSLNKKEKQRKSWFFWTVDFWESEMWAGNFESHADVAEWAGDFQCGSPAVDQRMIDDIWAKADEYMALEAPAMACEAWKRLPLCYHKFLGESCEEGSCFLCMASVSATMSDRRWIQVCHECATRFK